MTEATWGDNTKTPAIDSTMSAALENVVRANTDVPEVTNLAGAVLAWKMLDPEHQAVAVLTPERPVMIDGASLDHIEGAGIAALAERMNG